MYPFSIPFWTIVSGWEGSIIVLAVFSLTRNLRNTAFAKIHHDRWPPRSTSDHCNPKLLPPPKTLAACTAVLMKIQVFLDFAYCRSVNIYGTACCLLASISKVFEVRYDYINIVFSNRHCVVSQKAWFHVFPLQFEMFPVTQNSCLIREPFPWIESYDTDFNDNSWNVVTYI